MTIYLNNYSAKLTKYYKISDKISVNGIIYELSFICLIVNRFVTYLFGKQKTDTEKMSLIT